MAASMSLICASRACRVLVPEGMVLGVSTSETADGMPGITFVAAVKYDLYNETLNLTMIDGQNPFAEGKTQLQLTRCPDN